MFKFVNEVISGTVMCSGVILSTAVIAGVSG